MTKGKSACRPSFQRFMILRAVLFGAMVWGVVTSLPFAAQELANTCNGRSELSYPTAPNFSAVGDTVRVRILVGAQSIQGGSTLTINHVRFALDCRGGGNLGLGCDDDGSKVSYQGNLTALGCGATVWSADHNVGDVLPNIVVFTPDNPLVIPANTAFCSIEFSVKIEQADDDSTPGAIEQVSGYLAGAANDAVCDTTPLLQASNSSSGSLRVCPSCDDGNVCTDDSCNRDADPEDPNGGCVHTPNNITCNDGNACTTGDVCVAGVCAGPNPVICTDDNICTDNLCDPAIGCVVTNNNNPCSDGNACTTGDICSGGACTPGGPTICNDNNACTTDTCDPQAGCQTTPFICNDNNACTTDTCDPVAGCQTTPFICNDNNACTTDSCDPIAGCQTTPVICNDNNACTTDSCDPIAGCQTTPVICNDNNACTTDSCDPIAGCQTTPVICNDNNACTTDSCDPIAGCQTTPVICNDNNACTTDTCDPIAGCQTTPVDCGDNNACTDDACNPVTGCTHSTTNCNDNNGCTTDSCDPATGCTHGTVVCADTNPCTDDSCDPASGCVFTNNSNPCDDGNVCTTTDVCTGGVCTGSGHLDCDDHNICTDDCCLPNVPGGCVNIPNTSPCEDGSICNGHEICTGGVCGHGEPLDCDDNNVCTDDCCDAITGCTHTNVPDCTQAQAGCLVTSGGVMNDGTVNPNIMATCDKSNFCGRVSGAPGVIGFPDANGTIEGYWTHQQKRKGNLHVMNYQSLVCGCNSTFDGTLCDPSGVIPADQMSGANSVCFSGIGEYTAKKARRPKQVAFRAVLQDHGDTAASDYYTIQIWVPKRGENLNTLAASVACTIPNDQLTVRAPNVADGDALVNGNVVIKPARTSTGSTMH